MLCPLCYNDLKTRADNEYFVCSRCGAYVKDKVFYIKPTEEKARYEEHNNDVNDTHYQQFVGPVVDLVLENFTPANTGLDYGCGTGPVIAKMLEDRSYQVTRYDPFFYPGERYLKHRYDFICSCEVFEHFHHPKHEIQKLRALLNPNGWIIIMTHIYNGNIDFNNWYYRKDPTHIFIYTEKTLRYIAEHFNFSLDIYSDRLVRFKKVPDPVN